jgi:hypothetical protein
MGSFMPAWAYGPRTLNFEAYDFELARPPAFLILEQFFGLFRAQDEEVNCVDPALKVGHAHSEQLS